MTLRDKYPKLSEEDILKLEASGLTKVQIDSYLSHFCGGLKGCAQPIIDSYNGDAKAQEFLEELMKLGDRAKNNVGDQRLMGQLNRFGIDNVEDIEVPILGSDNLHANSAQSHRADIVLKNGTAIEVGGPAKGKRGGGDFAKQIKALIKKYGIDKVEIHLEDTGSSASRRAIKHAISILAQALGDENTDRAADKVITFPPSDRLCTDDDK